MPKRLEAASNGTTMRLTLRPPICVLLGSLLWVSDATACSCIRIEGADPVAAVTDTDAVFRARVVATAVVLTNDDGTIVEKSEGHGQAALVQRLVAFRIEELFKGEVAPLTILVTGGGCGYEFENGKEYVVFATWTSEKRVTTLARSAPVLTTSICSFTQLADDATALLKSLREKFPPRKAFWLSWPE